MESFTEVMIANDVPEERYIKMMPLCLETIDKLWLRVWIAEQGGDGCWSNFYDAFIAHFQNPNTRQVWLDQVRTLKMDSTGVQKYTDQFVKLINNLGRHMNDEDMVYHYLRGLDKSMRSKLSVAMTGASAAGKDVDNVVLMGQMCKRIESQSDDDLDNNITIKKRTPSSNS